MPEAMGYGSPAPRRFQSQYKGNPLAMVASESRASCGRSRLVWSAIHKEPAT